jgi:uncharacterized protein (DUF1810 family)
MKLRSSPILFACADKDPNDLFRQALDRWLAGEQDDAILKRL